MYSNSSRLPDYIYLMHEFVMKLLEKVAFIDMSLPKFEIMILYILFSLNPLKVNNT